MPIWRDERSAQDPRFSKHVIESLSRTGLERMQESLDYVYALDPDWAELYIQYIRGDLYSRDVLPQSVREICACAALATLGWQNQVRTHLRNGYALGATKEELLEALLQSVAYAGFPATLNAIRTYGEVFPEMVKRDRPPVPASEGEPPKGPLYPPAVEAAAAIRGPEIATTQFEWLNSLDPDFSLAFQRFVHGGLYQRRVLDPKVRQLLAVACCVVKNAQPQLEFHARGGLRMGLKREEVREVIFQMSAYTGFPYVLQCLQVYERMADAFEVEQRGEAPA